MEKRVKNALKGLLRTTGGLVARQEAPPTHFSEGLPLFRFNNNNNNKQTWKSDDKAVTR